MALSDRIYALTARIAAAINARSGIVGASTFDLAVINGYTGTQTQWLRDARPAAARAWVNAAQSLAAGGGVVTLDALDFNDDATVFTYDPSGITAKMAGLYLLNWQVSMTLPANAAASAYLTANGVLAGAQSDAVAGTSEKNGTTVLRLAANTKVVLNAYSASAITLNKPGQSGTNFLSLTRLGG